MFLFLSTCGILRIHSLLWKPLLPMALHLHRFLYRHLLGAFQLVQCHHQLGPDLCSEFSLDLRTRCSAILVSRLLRIVHNIGFCGFHFFAQVEIEDVVFDADWNELFLPCELTNLSKFILISWPICCARESRNTAGFQIEILSSFARDFSSTAQHFVCISESLDQRSTQTAFIVTLELPSSHIHHWLFDRIFHLLLHGTKSKTSK